MSDCQHCHNEPASRSRGLGYRCFYTMSIRVLYQRTNARQPRVRPVHPLPSQPTEALPGSDEKTHVMQDRVARGELANHPNDAKRE